MSSVRLSGNAGGTGTFTLQSPNSNNSQTVSIPDGTGTMAVAGVSSSIVSGTSQASTSGTFIDFTGIPAYVKRITVMFNGVSTNGTSNIQVQVGTSGSITTSGYVGTVSNQAGTTANNSTGFQVANTVTAADVYWGHVVLTKTGANATQVSETSILANSNAANARYSAGAVTPANTIDTVRITTVNGTDTFDAGTINILYE